MCLLFKAGLFFPDESEAVAEGKDDAFKLSAGGHEFIESVEGHGLGVVIGDRVGHFPVPQRIVGYDEASAPEPRENLPEIFDVAALVGVDIYEVPCLVKLADKLFGIPYMECDAVAAGSCGEEFKQFLLHLVVHLDGVQLAAGGKSVGQSGG